MSGGLSPRLDVAEKQVNWSKSTVGRCRHPPHKKQNMKLSYRSYLLSPKWDGEEKQNVGQLTGMIAKNPPILNLQADPADGCRNFILINTKWIIVLFQVLFFHALKSE